MLTTLKDTGGCHNCASRPAEADDDGWDEESPIAFSNIAWDEMLWWNDTKRYLYRGKPYFNISFTR